MNKLDKDLPTTSLPQNSLDDDDSDNNDQEDDEVLATGVRISSRKLCLSLDSGVFFSQNTCS